MAEDDNESNDVNKSNKRYNGSTLDDFYKKIPQQHDESHAKQSQRTDELSKRLVNNEKVLKEKEDQYKLVRHTYPENGVKLKESIERLKEYNDKIVHQLVEEDIRYSAKVNEDIASSVERHTRIPDINARTTTMSRSHSLRTELRSDMALIASTPTEQIENRIRQNAIKIEKLGHSYGEQQRALGTGEDLTPEMKENLGLMEKLERETARDKATIAVQIKEGLTSEKQLYQSKELETRVRGYLGHRELEGKVGSGEFGSLEENVKKLSEMLEIASEAVKKFEEATSESSSATEEDRKRAFTEKEKAQQDLKRQYDIVGMFRGGGGGDRGTILSNVSSLAGGAASVLGNMGVTQEIKNLSLRSSYANVVNDMYLKSEKAAISGDLNAALSFANIDAIESKRKELSTNRSGSAMLEILASGAAAIGAGYAGNTGGAAAGTANVVNTTADLTSGNLEAAAGLQGIQAMQALDESTRFIRTRQMQSYYNIGLSSYQSAAGLGGGGRGMQSSLLSDRGLADSLANAGVSLQDAIQLMPMLGEAGAFSSAQGFDVMHGAGRAMQRGQMSREAYVSSAAAIMGAGGASGDLETIIQNAMQRGMDNSKNISQMVSATLSLNANIAKSGVGAVSELEKMMDMSVSSLNNFKLDKNLTTSMAQAGLSNVDTMLRSTDINFGNVSEMSMLTKTFSGASIDQIQDLATMGIGDIGLLKGALGKDEESLKKLRAQMQAAGTSSLLFNEEGRLMEDKAGSLIDMNMKSMVINKTSHLGISADDVMSQLKSGKITEQVRAALNLGAPGTADAAIGILSTAAAPDKKQAPPPNNIGANQQITSAKFQAEQAFQGKEFLEGISKAAELNMSAIEVAQSIIKTAAEIAPAEKWDEIAQKAAASFSVPVSEFKTVINKDLKGLLDANQAILNEVMKKLGVSLKPKGYGAQVAKNDNNRRFR